MGAWGVKNADRPARESEKGVESKGDYLEGRRSNKAVLPDDPANESSRLILTILADIEFPSMKHYRFIRFRCCFFGQRNPSNYIEDYQ